MPNKVVMKILGMRFHRIQLKASVLKLIFQLKMPQVIILCLIRPTELIPIIILEE